MTIVEYLWANVPYFLLTFALMYGSYKLLSLRSSKVYNGTEQLLQGNLAVALRRTGFLLGVGISVLTLISGPSSGILGQDLVNTASFGLVAIGMQWTALWVNDTFILPGIRNCEEIGKGNLAVAFVEAGGMIGTGLVAAACMKGEGTTISAIYFFALGQVVMVLSVLVYELIRSQHRLVASVGRGNRAAGVLLGSKLVSYGFILSGAVAGGFTGWLYDTTAFAIAAISGMAFLYIAELAADKVVFPQKSIKSMIDEDNVAAMMVIASIKIAMAMAIGQLVL